MTAAPKLPVLPSEAEAAAELLRRKAAKDSLHEFLKQAWHVIEPGYDFLDNWHLHALAEHLEAVHRGEIRNLLVNVPPRSLKTSLVSVAFPAWVWLQRPTEKFVYGSYSEPLAEDASIKCRRLVTSRWFKARWGKEVPIAEDRTAKDYWGNAEGGERIITAVDATFTGRGGDVIVCLPYDAWIETVNGPRRIGEIVEGEEAPLVYSYDVETGAVVEDRIVAHEKNDGRPLLVIEASNGAAVSLTDEHPVFVDKYGWIKACDVSVGDTIFATPVDRRVRRVFVRRIRRVAKVPDAVYNIRVERNRNYFANGLLLHNCDDLNNPRNTSDIVLDNALHFWTHVVPTRFNDPKKGRLINVQQRVHERDVSGYILSNYPEDWVKLILPMEFESARRAVTVVLPSTKGKKWQDPRKTEGELLMPDRWGRAELETLKKRLGSEYAIAGQLQQRPAPAEGGIIKRAWFQMWKQPEPPDCDIVILSLDTAMSEKKSAAFNAATTWGVFRDDRGIPSVILLSMWRERCEYPELRERIQRMAHNYLDDQKEPLKGGKARRPDLILIEAKASGLSLIQDLMRAGVTATRFNPDKLGDKTNRVKLITPVLESGRVYVPAKPPDYTKPRDFADQMITQCIMFPAASSRDLVDTMTQALWRLHSTGWIYNAGDPPPPPQYTTETQGAIY